MTATIIALLAMMSGANNLQSNRAYDVVLRGQEFVCFKAENSAFDYCAYLGEDWE